MKLDVILPVLTGTMLICVMLIPIFWSDIECTPTIQRLFIRGQWINKSLGVAYLQQANGYVFFKKFDKNHSNICSPMADRAVHSSQIVSMARKMNTLPPGSWIAARDTNLNYHSYKGEEKIEIGCQKLTYKEANCLISYLRRKGVDIEKI